MAIREGKWDCPQCGFKGNRGSEQKCRGCSKVRGNEVQFYVDDDAAEVTDEAQLAKAASGADWICQFCDAINPAGGKQCRSCGAERTEKKRTQKEILDQAPAPVPPKKSRTGLFVGLGALLAAVVGGWFVCSPSEKALQLSEVSWERTVEVEAYGTVREEAWKDELPSGARVQSTTSKVHHTNKVQTGTKTVSKTVEEKVQTGTRKVKVGKKDLGNGYFEDITKDEPVYEKRSRTVTEQEPVYREDPVNKDWCTYDIDKWHKARVERAGAKDGSPRWPDTHLAGDKEREGAKTEVYRAVFKDPKGKTYEWKKAPLDAWQKLKVGEGYKVVVKLGDVTGLAPAK